MLSLSSVRRLAEYLLRYCQSWCDVYIISLLYSDTTKYWLKTAGKSNLHLHNISLRFSWYDMHWLEQPRVGKLCVFCIHIIIITSFVSLWTYYFLTFKTNTWFNAYIPIKMYLVPWQQRLMKTVASKTTENRLFVKQFVRSDSGHLTSYYSPFVRGKHCPIMRKSLPLESCQIRRIVGCACAGNAAHVFPANDFKGSR